MKSDAFKIGELAEEAEVNVETIRFYERKGLIKQPSKASGFRKYSAQEVSRIRFIKRAQSLGFQLKEIQELLRWENPGRISCSSLEKKIQAKVLEVDEKIKDLRQIKKSLIELQGCCKKEDFTSRECKIAECLNSK